VWRSHPDVIAILLLLMVTVPSRLLHLAADPPPDIGQGVIWDEGLWAHNARVHELFGVWVVDDHNPPLAVAPLYTVTMTAVYRVLGFGLAQTRLVSAIGGIFTCLALYLGLRAVRSPGRSLAAALVFSLGFHALSHQRVGFTEAYQLLWVVIGFAGVLWATRYPPFGFIGGSGLTMAQLVKPSALILGPVVVAYWVWRALARPGRTPVPRMRWSEIGWFAGGAALVAALVAMIAIPHWAFVWEYLAVSMENVGVPTRIPSIELFGGLAHLPPSHFALQSVTQILVVGAFAWKRLLEGRDGEQDLVEQIAWIWLGLNLLFLSEVVSQPDRRFLLLAPPLAILTATAFERRSAGGADAAQRPGSVIRRLGAGILIGIAVGWALASIGLWGGVDRSIKGWSKIWTGTTLATTLGTALLPASMIRRVSSFPLWVLLPAFLLLEPVHFALHLANPKYSVLNAAETLAALSHELPLRDRVITGPVSATLALESRIFPVIQRTRTRLNMDVWERFSPALALRRIERTPTPLDAWEAYRRGYHRCTVFELLPDRPREDVRIELWVRPDLANRCEAVVRQRSRETSLTADSTGAGS
jgi:4-amino-4-deoxy-L-arabinose transferase-like glycosyltransferase